MKLSKGLYIVVLGISLWCSLVSAQITCSSGSACQTNFVPVFTSNGGNAKVADSIIRQSGSAISVGGSLTATGPISGSEFEIGGSLFAFGSATNAYLGFAGNPYISASDDFASGYQALASEIEGNDDSARRGLCTQERHL